MCPVRFPPCCPSGVFICVKRQPRKATLTDKETTRDVQLSPGRDLAYSKVNLTMLKPNKSQEQTHDCGKILTIAAKRLKNLAGNIQNINESKINLDS